MNQLVTRLFIITLAIIPLTSCDPAKKKFAERGRLSEIVENSFSKAFPAHLPPSKKPPSIGAIGDVLEDKELTFIAFDFPASKQTELESWLGQVITKVEVDSISISLFGVDEKGLLMAGDMKRITVMKDGSLGREAGLDIEDAMPNPSANGRPLNL